LNSKVKTFLIGICKLKNKDKLEKEDSRQTYLNELDDEIYDPYLNEDMGLTPMYVKKRKRLCEKDFVKKTCIKR
jgi:hypothetical protein